ncbi:IclR family transcriptional regulator [Actinomadura sp. B10D3]|uniref:IclR family transcriptional regulator n=1 Tax=Actinomadura sp. B10D3 TaxID=3153557 RepID=UPI00325D9547
MHDTNGPIDPRYHLDAAARTIDLLQAVAEYGPASVAALTSKLGWSKPMVYRLVRTLHACGALTLRDDGYVLGPVMISLGRAALRSVRPVEAARPAMARIHEACGESTVLTVLDGTYIVYVDFIEADHLLVVKSRLGSRLPAAYTASGHALLSRHSPDEIRALYDGHTFEPPTPRAVSSVEDLLERLERVRADGYAVIDQELTEGHRASAAPVPDHTGSVAAAISISVPSARVSMDRLVSLTETVLVPETRLLGTALGYGGDPRP